MEFDNIQNDSNFSLSNFGFQILASSGREGVLRTHTYFQSGFRTFACFTTMLIRDDQELELNLELKLVTTSRWVAGVDILALALINIVEINKQYDETWKGIRKIRHL